MSEEQNFVEELPVFSAQMVAELAARIQEPKDILARYGVDLPEFERMKKNPLFRQAYKEAKQFWESDTNAKDRIAVKAQVMVEDYLLTLGNMFRNTDMSVSARMDAFGKLMKLAKVDGGEPRAAEQGATPAAININIDMGAQQVTATIEGELADEN